MHQLQQKVASLMFMLARPNRSTIDQLMLLEKELAGAPTWTIAPRQGEQRCKFPVKLNGQITQLFFVIDVHPRERQQSFTLTLNYVSCIMRLDHHDVRHRNSKVKNKPMPYDIPLGMLDEPHIHTWADNSVLGSDKKLPEELKFARPIPAQVRGYENAFRYFCGLAKISFLESQFPTYPDPDSLL